MKKVARREYLGNSAKVMLNKQLNLERGNDVVMTVPNPDKNNTRERFVKIRVSGKDHLNHLKSVKRVESSAATKLAVEAEMAQHGKSWDSVRGDWV